MKDLTKIYVKENLLNKNKPIINTWSRSTIIIEEFVGQTFNVYNGKTFIPVEVKKSMVGYKLGEFSPTRSLKKKKGK